MSVYQVDIRQSRSIPLEKNLHCGFCGQRLGLYCLVEEEFSLGSSHNLGWSYRHDAWRATPHHGKAIRHARRLIDEQEDPKGDAARSTEKGKAYRGLYFANFGRTWHFRDPRVAGSRELGEERPLRPGDKIECTRCHRLSLLGEPDRA